jgi:uncharacterized protein (DUF736 family)
MEQKRDDSIGALWKKEGPKGAYYTGVIELNGEKINVVAFPNRMKKSEKSPDVRILRSKTKEELQQQPKKETFSDDIPFDTAMF